MRFTYYLFCLVGAIAVTVCACGGNEAQVKPDAPSATSALDAEIVGVMKTLDTVFIIDSTEGIQKSEVEYRTFGGEDPKPADYFIRFSTMVDENKAWEKFKVLHKKFPNAPYGLLGQANVYRRWKMFDKAHDNLEQAKQIISAQSPLLALFEADVYYSEGRLDKAKEDYQVVLGKAAGNLRATFSLAQIYQKENKPEEAIKLYQAAIEAEPKVFFLQSELGDLLINAKRPDEALVCYLKAIEIDPSKPSVYGKAALVYEEKENADEAIKYYEKNVELNPADEKALAKLQTLYKNKGDKENEFKTLSKIIEFSDDLANHLRIGELAYDIGKADRAASAFETVLKRDPENITALWGSAKSYKKLGQNLKAVQNYLKLLSLKPDFEEVKKEYDTFKGEFQIGEPIKAPNENAIYNKVTDYVLKAFKSELEKNPKLSGEVEIKLKTNKAGKVTSVEFQKDTLNNETIKACLYGNIFEAQFPPVPEKEVEGIYEFPFSFTPAK